MAENCDGAAVQALGSILQVEDPDSSTFIDVGGLTDFNGPQTQREEIDTTTLCSAAKEYALGLKDFGTLTCTMQTRFGDPAQQILLENMNSPSALNFKLIIPDDGYGNGKVTCEFKARVQSFPIQGSVGQNVTSNLSLRITGDVKFTFPNNP